MQAGADVNRSGLPGPALRRYAPAMKLLRLHWLGGLALAAALAGGGPASAACADREPDPERRADLLDALAEAETEAEGRAAADAMWRLWHEAPDDKAQALLDRVHERRRWQDLEAAEEAARKLTAYCPRYAEGWNQLATVQYMRGNLDGALASIERVLALEPRHFGALSGRGLILMRQGRVQAAQKALRAAVEIHPWSPERALLVERGEPL